MPQEALTSFTVSDAYRQFAGQVRKVRGQKVDHAYTINQSINFK